jgi:hypothetical protein
MKTSTHLLQADKINNKETLKKVRVDKLLKSMNESHGNNERHDHDERRDK